MAIAAALATPKLMTPTCLSLSSSSFSRTPRLFFFTSSKSPSLSISSTFSFPLSQSLNLRRRRRFFKSPPKFTTSAAATTVSASLISVGDTLPDSTLSYLDPSGDVQTITISSLTKSKKTILFAVPGAFTPTCSQKHLPGFVEKAPLLKSKGVDTIACISVNDAFVMRAWKDHLNVGDQVLLLSDGNADFTRKIGAQLDLTDKPVGLGVRSRRYAMLVEDGVVKALNMEEGGAFTFSGADDMLKLL